MTLKQLIAKYEKERANYISSKSLFNETEVRNEYIDPFFELLGWDIKNTSAKPTNEREVILEEGLKANASENSKKPDYTFRLFSERKFFVEAKKPSVKIESDNETAKQVRRYGFTAKLKISILTNFEYLHIYDTSIKVEKDDIFHKALIKTYRYTEYESKFDEIKNLVGRDVVYSGAFDTTWSAIELQINQYSIDNLFLGQINTWRKLLGAEIFKHNPKIKEQELNDVVQSYLNRILFLRVCEDRELEVYETLLKYATESDFNALIAKFKQADRKYNSGLFDQLLSDKIIQDVSSVFWTIIKQLYYPESAYSFAVFSSDVLGSIYEIFLSERLVIKKQTIELVKKPENLDRDIITTPTFIINDILRNTVLVKCHGKTDAEILKLTFADISCGSGAFLLEMFQLLNDIFIDYYLAVDKSKLIQIAVNTYKLPFSIKCNILLNCIYGVDKDFNAVEATKFGLLLKLLEQEDTRSVASNNPVLPSLDNNIYFGNSLLNLKNVKSINKSKRTLINPFDFVVKFDVIVGNPPYMKSEDMKNITPLEFPLYKTIYDSAYKQFDKYFLFIEQSINLLAQDGLLGYIVPNKFSKVGAALKLREIITGKQSLVSIVSFGANQIFTDKTTYTCLLILTNKPQQTFKFAEVKDLKAWKVRDVSAVNIDTKVTKDLDNEVWVLVPPELKVAYTKIATQSKKLGDLVGEDYVFNGIQTSANLIYVFVPTKEDAQYYYFLKDKVEYQIEKEITKPYFKTSSGTNSLNTYRTFKPNARVIYPYNVTPSGVALIDLVTISTLYPLAHKYLLDHKSVLNSSKRDIDPPPTTPNEWHRYGRVQSLDSCGLPMKIIVGVLSVGDKYAVDTYGTLITSGGTAGYCVVAQPADSPYSIYYLQAILNSKYVEWCCGLNGEIFRGGYIARGTKVLMNLPIREINFKDKTDKKLHDEIAKTQKELIAVHDQIDSNIGNKRVIIPLIRQFDKLKVVLDKKLATLYNLGTDDALIPMIKQMYV